MRRDCVDDYIGSNQAGSSSLEAVYTTQAWAKIAITEVSIGLAALLSLLLRGKELVSGDVAVEEKLWCQCGFRSPLDQFM
jgi:hypothetical protein